MKVLKPRSRMISVRLSEAEYDDLCRLSVHTGARSLSDLARDAMRLLLKISNHDRLSTDTLGSFQAQMDQLNRRIDELRDHLMSSNRRAEQD
jgi:Arc/MetJ-type ribon-helix-helix transcriptional regulator